VDSRQSGNYQLINIKVPAGFRLHHSGFDHDVTAWRKWLWKRLGIPVIDKALTVF
jgi:hypothetical protein